MIDLLQPARGCVGKHPQRAGRMKTRCRQAVVATAKPLEDRPLLFSRDQEGRMPAALERRIGQRDTRFGLGADDGGNPLVAFREHRVAWEQRGCMAIRPQPKKIHVEERPSRVETLRAVEGFELALIGGRRRFRAEPFGTEWDGC